MSLREKIKSFFSRSREKHKLSFIDDVTYREKWSFRVSSFNLSSLLGLYTILVLTATLLLIKYTPLKALFAENDLELRDEVNHTSFLIDSLAEVTASRELYINNLRAILLDEPFNDSTANTLPDSLKNYVPKFKIAPSDSILRNKVEKTYTTGNVAPSAETYEFFFAPVQGIVSQSFNRKKDHNGVDIVTQEDEPIKTCLEGTIILTGWIQSEGNIIVVQHKGDLISIYKHCSAVLKPRGSMVQTGDPIGIVGNSGENSTGPHLHFELWKRGQPIDPEDYISF